MASFDYNQVPGQEDSQPVFVSYVPHSQPTQQAFSYPPYETDQTLSDGRPTAHFSGGKQQAVGQTFFAAAEASCDIDLNMPNKTLEDASQYVDAPRQAQSPYTRHSSSMVFQEELCGCFDHCGSFCLALWCPCIQLGINQTNLRVAQIENAVSGRISADYASDAEMSGFLWGFGYWVARCVGLQCIVGCLNRSQLRNEFSIVGNECEDCCVHFWCIPCAIAQEAREINRRITSPHVQFCQPRPIVLVIDSFPEDSYEL